MKHIKWEIHYRGNTLREVDSLHLALKELANAGLLTIVPGSDNPDHRLFLVYAPQGDHIHDFFKTLPHVSIVSWKPKDSVEVKDNKDAWDMVLKPKEHQNGSTDDPMWAGGHKQE
jgi:hypothetical protein